MPFTDDLQYKDQDGVKLAERGFKRMNDPRPNFTDEKLAWLNRFIAEQEPEFMISKSLMKALLARLEAAEAHCAASWNVEDLLEVPAALGASSKIIIQKAIEKFHDTYKAWRGAAGK